MTHGGSDTTLTLPFSLRTGHPYTWEVRAENATGHIRTSRETYSFSTTGSSAAPIPAPAPVAALSVGPNPSRGAVDFILASSPGPIVGPLDWTVLDPMGRRVASAPLSAQGGAYQGRWNGLDVGGRPTPAGVYYLEVRLGQRLERRTLVRLPN